MLASRNAGLPRASTPLSHFALRLLLDAIGRPPLAFVLWDGSEVSAGSPPLVRVRVRSPGVLWRLLRNPNLGFGEAYADGALEVDGDLAQTIDLVFRASVRAPGLAARLLDALGARR